MRRCSQGRLVEYRPSPHEMGEEIVTELVGQLLLPRFATPWQTLPAPIRATKARNGAYVSCFTPPLEGRAGVRALTRDHHSGTDLAMNRAKEPVPQADLGDEIWTIRHICAYFNVRISAAYDKAREPGFPAPLGGSRRCRRWHSAHVRAFAAEPTRQLAQGPRPAPGAGQMRRRRVAA
jgi:hypothetical protein